MPLLQSIHSSDLVDERWTLQARRRAVLCLVLFGLLGMGETPVVAQTAADTVTDRQGDVLFQVPEPGGLLAPGSFGQGGLPRSGPGTRLLWAPGKAAFRAGRVGFGMSAGTEWDAAAVGAYSLAVGLNTSAAGRGAVALGQGTEAPGSQAVAGGYRTTAAGLRTVTFGDMTTARGNFSTALGLNTTASSMASVALGRWNVERGVGDAWRGTDPLLVAGNGTGPSNRSNALTLQKNGDLTIAGTLTEHSDRRLKTDIRPLGRVTPALEQLQPVRYRFEAGRGHPTDPQVGLLAQDVQAAFPSLVETGGDGWLSLAYPRLTAVLLKGLQEQRTRIDSLQQRLAQVEALAEQHNQLASEVAALKADSERPSNFRLGGLGGRAGLVLLVIGGVVGAGLGRRWGGE